MYLRVHLKGNEHFYRTKDTEEQESRWKKDVRSRELVLTEHIEGESEARQAETLKEAQCAEHGDIYREGYSQTEHQHEKHRQDQHRVSTEP